ncbi:MAG: LysR family transcriptional regulator [Rhizobiales bacterium 65-9]|nr:LysR family transcriptional regulator [Hyphomicrobiales bacterium]OJY38544.1 MAG: LysR family transcriptional regulator [Rhizobiales bacterium 65-9]
MDWDHARVFLAVARSGQMLAASRRLGLDQATVTRRINGLERDLGAKLLERSPAGSSLTAAGERFLQSAERIESEMLRAQGELTDSAVSIAGTVRIGAPDGVGTWYLLPLLAPLLAQHPDLHVQLAPLPRAFSLAKREADLAIMVDPPDEGRQRIVKLTDYSLGLYASRDYARRHAPIEAPADIASHRVVSYVRDLLFSSALDYLDELNIPAGRRFECASVIGQLEAVRAGIGVGVLHDYAAQRDPDFVRLLPDRAVRRTYWLVTHADVRDVARVRLVHDFILASARRDRALFAAGGR